MDDERCHGEMDEERHSGPEPWDDRRGDAMEPNAAEGGGGAGDPDECDDERLIMFALGLEADPELEDMLTRSPQLKERFERIDAELQTVEAGIRDAVPAEDADWADLSAERWAHLRPYVGVPGEERRQKEHAGFLGRIGRNWRTVVPALSALVVVALGVGLVLSRGGVSDLTSPRGTSGESSVLQGSSYGSAATPADATTGKSAGGAVPSVNGAGGGTPRSITGAGADRTAVVATAGKAANGVQAFAVDRVLKGDAPHTVRLQVEVGAQVKRGTLVALFLDPVETSTPCPTPTLSPAHGGASAPAPSPTAGRASASTAPVYLYEGECAAVVPLPPGTGADAVSID